MCFLIVQNFIILLKFFQSRIKFSLKLQKEKKRERNLGCWTEVDPFLVAFTADTPCFVLFPRLSLICSLPMGIFVWLVSYPSPVAKGRGRKAYSQIEDPWEVILDCRWCQTSPPGNDSNGRSERKTCQNGVFRDFPTHLWDGDLQRGFLILKDIIKTRGGKKPHCRPPREH